MYLFFDTETTGLGHHSDHIVQIAWIVAGNDGNVEVEECHVIRPDGYEIPDSASRIHGITTAKACEIGEPLASVLNRFTAAAARATVLVAHNFSFDFAILQHDYICAGLPFPLNGRVQVCTMKLSAAWCRLPKLNGGSGFKWPKLDELHYRLFGIGFSDAHDALADTRACMRSYFELVAREVITPPPINLQRNFSHARKLGNSEVQENSLHSKEINNTTAAAKRVRHVQDFGFRANEDVIAYVGMSNRIAIQKLQAKNSITPNLANSTTGRATSDMHVHHTPTATSSSLKPIVPRTNIKSLYDALGVTLSSSEEQIIDGYKRLKAEIDVQGKHDAEINKRLILLITYARDLLLAPDMRADHKAKMFASNDYHPPLLEKKWSYFGETRILRNNQTGAEYTTKNHTRVDNGVKGFELIHDATPWINDWDVEFK